MGLDSEDAEQHRLEVLRKVYGNDFIDFEVELDLAGKAPVGHVAPYEGAEPYSLSIRPLENKAFGETPSALLKQHGDAESRQPAMADANLPEFSEGKECRLQKYTGRPKLPADALQTIVDVEKAATEQLLESLKPYSPSTPGFVYQAVEINAACWKVIDHLTIFAGAIFDAQAREYFKYYPDLVIGGDLLTNEITPEVDRRTKLQWTRWETDVDWALRTRWTPHYRAYVEEANEPGSEDQKLVRHFLNRLSDMLLDRTTLWKQKPEAGSREAPGESKTSTQIEVAREPEQIGQVASSGIDSRAPQRTAPVASLDFASEAGRNSAVASYTNKWSCSGASLARSANVHPADLSKWKKSRPPVKSDKRSRIEKVLNTNALPTPKARQDSGA